MANVVRDPRLHPEAVLGDFVHPSPFRTFSLDDVALVYGSRYKQRYFARRGSDYFLLPAQWDIAKKRWLPYHVEDGANLGRLPFDSTFGPLKFETLWAPVALRGSHRQRLAAPHAHQPRANPRPASGCGSGTSRSLRGLTQLPELGIVSRVCGIYMKPKDEE